MKDKEDRLGKIETRLQKAEDLLSVLLLWKRMATMYLLESKRALLGFGWDWDLSKQRNRGSVIDDEAGVNTSAQEKGRPELED